MRTEKEKMLAGELYVAADPQLVAERLRARQLTLRLNTTDPADEATYRAVMAELLRALDMREMTYGWPTEMTVKAARRGARAVSYTHLTLPTSDLV